MELQQLQMMLKGCDIAAYFHGAPGREDLKWSLKLIDGLPDSIIPDLYTKYLRTRKKGESADAKTANTWLRTRVATFKKLLRSFPVPISELRNEEHRAMVATEWANKTAQILSNETNGNSEQREAEELFKAVGQPAEQWSFLSRPPKFKTYEALQNWVAAILIRLLDAKWWTRKINRAWDRYTEHAAILMGKVRKGVSAYISAKNMNIYRNRKAAARRWMQQMLVVNPQYELELTLEEAVSKSVSNPEIRRHELMVRMRGFEDTAAEIGYTGVFITWTAPSKYHAWKQTPNGRVIENEKYNGSTPQQTQRYLSRLWSQCRAALAREEIQVFGFRVAEPHHDATPHWHMLVFVHPDQMGTMISIMQRYAIMDDKEELVRKPTKKNGFSGLATDFTPRFSWQVMDPKEGGATGYIAKYIAKNLDGHAVGEDWEAETLAEEGATAAGAWANWHGIRQFQQIGGPSVSVWRECRRLKDPEGPCRDMLMESIRHTASVSNWRAYTDLMGGPVLPRRFRPVRLLHIIKEAQSRYGEDIQKIMGVMGRTESRISRLDGWVISATGLDAREPLSFAARQGSASIGRAEGAAPWSSDNNCTELENQRADQRLAEHFDRLGLDEWMIELLHKRAILKNDGQFIWLKDGELHVSNKHPTYDGGDESIDRQFDAELRRETAEKVVWIRRQMWRLVENGDDIEVWMQSHTESEQEIALHQLGDIVEQMERERYQQQYAEQLGSKYNLRG